MSTKELLVTLAKRFAARGANQADALRTLELESRLRLSNILDKFGSFMPTGHEVRGFVITKITALDNVFTAHISINSEGTLVKAARVTYVASASA